MDFELKNAIAAIGESVDEMKKTHREEMAELQSYAERIEAKIKAPGAGGLSFGSRAEIETQRADINAFCRGDFKAMTVSVDPQGGYLVPSILQPTITEKLYDPPTLLSLVRTEQWDGGGSTWIEPLKRAFVTARRRDGGETQAAADTGTTDPLGLLEVEAGEAEASCTLSQKLLDDVSRDLSGMVIGDISAALDRQIDQEIVSGIGASQQAQGFLSVPAVTTSDATRAWGQIQYVPTLNATALTADSLLDLIYTLRAPYRGGASFVMSSATAAVVSKMKSGDGDYLWRNSLAAGQPPTLLGFPVNCDENMPAIGANAFPIAFAQWRMAYLVARKLPTRLLRDPYSAKPSTIIFGYKRQGGAVANSEAIKLLKVSLT